TDVAHEHQQDDRNESHTKQQVLRDRFGRDVKQVLTVVIRLNLYAGEHPPGSGIVELLDFGFDVFQSRKRVLVLAQKNDALHLVVLVMADVSEGKGRTGRPVMVSLPISDSPQARLVADDDTLVRGQLARGNSAALDDILNAHRLVVDGGDNQVADVMEAALLLRAQ